MKAPVFALAATLTTASAFAGITQTHLLSLVSAATGVEVRHREVLLFTTVQKKEIAEVISAFELVDPVVEKAKDGEEAFLPVCFCIPEYTITFTGLADGTRSFGLKDNSSKVLPPEKLGLNSIADIQLSKRSRGQLKGLIARWEKSQRNAAPARAPHSSP